MKNLKYIVSTFLLFLILGGCFSTFKANASTIKENQSTYNRGVASGNIDKSKLSLEQWLVQSKNFHNLYQQGLRLGMYKFSYEKWLEYNNYGQGPLLSPKVSEQTAKGTGSFYIKTTAQNVKPGDVLITNSTSSAGILGHAAICDREGYILDMPGSGGGSTSDNNRESKVSDWFNDYAKSGYYIKVYHAQDHSSAILGERVAKYAHDNFWGVSSDNEKKVHIPYRISPFLYDTSSMYCSKLVYDAFWFTSNSNHLIKQSGIYETPYELPCDILYPLTVTSYNF